MGNGKKTGELNITSQLVRMVEAMVFASSQPVTQKALEERLPIGANVDAIVDVLQKNYHERGVHFVKVGDAYAFRTAADLAFLFNRKEESSRKLSRAALEVLAIIAYHQPVTRAELEDIRGVETSKGTLDVLLETQWIKIRGRRRTPGRPVTYGTTRNFLDHFSLADIQDLPGVEELKGAGLLSTRMTENFQIPLMSLNLDELSDDEDPLDGVDKEDFGLLTSLEKEEKV
ncbi:segregation and condensation protein B [Bartonella tamiae Th307]|uniref:Segregation and condensation protein B n=2 Tax=Bartonella tamiae TaxID=373638 RepID=J1K0W8_9HYPH|nr:segregation and condensation protein B [Bartonella tamiae Th239]EJF93928.1 segregation and condensation protein B [Bartonella tamiae Th307]